MDDDPWAEVADDWDTDEATRTYARAAYEHLEDILALRGPALDGATVCDFGAGTGLLTELLAPRAAHIDAVDSSPAMLDRLRSKIRSHGWTEVTASPVVPAPSTHHDLVVCSSVLAFVDDLDATVAALAALLRPGGALVHWDWERTDDHDHGLTRREIGDALARAELSDVEVGTAFELRIGDEIVHPVYGAGWRR